MLAEGSVVSLRARSLFPASDRKVRAIGWTAAFLKISQGIVAGLKRDFRFRR
jgi:hypothetical protein